MNLFSAIQIQTIDGCNLKCPWCPNSYRLQTGNLMDVALYQKIIDQLAELEYQGRVSPYLMNESLLDKRLLDLVAYTRKKLPKADIMITTNGTLMTREYLLELQQAGMSQVHVSCYTKALCDKIRGWEVQAVRLFSFFGSNIRGTRCWDNRGGNVDWGPRLSGPLEASCRHPFQQMYIDYQGRAILCCSDYHRQVTMASAAEEALVKIWNNEKYSRYRKLLGQHRRDLLALCNKCNFK